MNDRAVTLAGGLVSLVLIIGLLFPQGGPGLEDMSLPTTEDRGPLGLHGLKIWLERNAVPSESLRRRYQSLLVDPDIADSGNLIVINQPPVTAPARAELEALTEWLSHGNYALILSARQDLPDWVKSRTSQDHPVLNALELEFDAPKDDGSPDVDKVQLRRNLSTARAVLTGEDRKPSTLVPAITHPLLDGISSVSSHRSIIFDQPPITLGGTTGSRHTLPLLARKGADGYAFWEFRNGSGGGWISSQPDLFGNVTLGLTDNARFFNNLINRALGEDGTVIFDDMHLGLSDLYDANNFFRDPRLHNTLSFIGLFWLVYLLGYSNRLAPLKQTATPLRSIEFVEAMSGYFARRIPPISVGRNLLTRFHTEVRNFYRQPRSDRPVAELLRSHSSIREKELRALDALTQKIADNKAVNLIQLTRTIDRIKRMMK